MQSFFGRPAGARALRSLLALFRQLATGAILALGCLQGCGSPSEQETATGLDPRGAEAALQRILLEPADLKRIGQLAATLDQLPPSALDGVLAAFETGFLDRGDVELVLLVHWWGRFDPEAAFQWAGEHWRSEHPRIEYEVIRAAARHDPQAATQMVLGMKFGFAKMRRSHVYDALIAGWFESGKPGLVEFVGSIPGQESFQRATSKLAQAHVQRDGPRAAMVWADELDYDEDMREIVKSRVLAHTANVDPPLAAKWAEAYPVEGYGYRPFQRVAMAWARRDPEAALAWVATLPEGKERNRSAVSAFDVWGERDPVAARSWIQLHTPAPWLDDAIKSLNRASVTARPIANREVWLARLETAERISHPDRRWSHIVWLVQTWRTLLGEDDSEALAWVAGRDDIPEHFRNMMVIELPTTRQL